MRKFNKLPINKKYNSNKFRSIALAVALNLANVSALASTVANDVLIKNLKSLSSIEANFIQTFSNSHGDKLNKISGKIYALRPNHFYFESENSFEPVLIADGKDFWIYDADLEQAVKKPIHVALKDSPLAVLLGDSNKVFEKYDLKDTYPSDCSEEEECKYKQKECFELLPKDELLGESKKITLCFTEDNLVSIRIKTVLDQYTEITFNKAKYNDYIGQSVFEFIPPDDTDIIESEI